MREQLNLRQADILLGRREERAELMAVTKKMTQEGELTQEQMEKLIRYMDESRKMPTR